MSGSNSAIVKFVLLPVVSIEALEQKIQSGSDDNILVWFIVGIVSLASCSGRVKAGYCSSATSMSNRRHCHKACPRITRDSKLAMKAIWDELVCNGDLYCH